MKRFFRYFILIPGVLFLLFLCLGLIWPVMHYHNSIIVQASPDESFAVFKDTGIMKLWITGLERVEFREGNMDYPGSKWNLILIRHGKHYKMEESLTAYEPGKRFAFLLENEVLFTAVDMRFTPSPQGTIITVDNEAKGKNLFWRSLLILSRTYIIKESQNMYNNLKLLIEKEQIPA